ncbi:MAG TPA: hypothetical protein VK207_00625 [Bacteroidales bacterium]|nr:hypothetical protein [Bacteroidales bacterium]
MTDTVKILTFDNEIEARLLSGLLDEMNIPHILRSYHDLAMDGLWQTQSSWGHLEAPDQYREEILKVFSEMSRPGNVEEII